MIVDLNILFYIFTWPVPPVPKKPQSGFVWYHLVASLPHLHHLQAASGLTVGEDLTTRSCMGVQSSSASPAGLEQIDP